MGITSTNNIRRNKHLEKNNYGEFYIKQMNNLKKVFCKNCECSITKKSLIYPEDNGGKILFEHECCIFPKREWHTGDYFCFIGKEKE